MWWLLDVIPSGPFMIMSTHVAEIADEETVVGILVVWDDDEVVERLEEHPARIVAAGHAPVQARLIRVADMGEGELPVFVLEGTESWINLSSVRREPVEILLRRRWSATLRPFLEVM